MDKYPHLSQTTTEDIWRYQFERRTTLPPSNLISNVNIVPFVGDFCLLIHFAGGAWEIPGGTLEPGETYRAALRRELREEAGADLRSFVVFGALHYHSFLPEPYRPHLPHPDFYRVVGYGQVTVKGSPQPAASDHEAVTEIALVPVAEAVHRFRAQDKILQAELYAFADSVRRNENLPS